ncbi:GlsB/YeaQ/YmgE family stress response membrane protein [Corallococcus sp. BB11-1]|uniref:GlsB/YeaQ/YmgE family stress response membrane protein n=1 Tax=Corallococcus sp. BB11-1 TaxID=2996783 RepID=UPI00226FED0B|nr:GlsB/YeaQ/YmgE family stress response membrane protein [Corallococcus sp. BB11-1]MCY1035066.1 GlsB/YeaQ/YmgE family stress response membrane protein [Corallococcus sp. BB11-1]
MKRSPLLFPLLALLLVSGLASAQEAPAEPATAPTRGLTPPPLVGAEAEDVPAPPDAESPEDAPSGSRPSVTAGALPDARPPPSKDPVPRVAVEALGGAAGGVVGATVLGSFGYLLGSATVGCDECLVMAVAGAAAGALIGIPVGTYAGGRFMNGRGRLGPTVAGSMVGWGATLLGISLVNSGGADAPPAVNAALFILPVVGASVGYELTHSSTLRAEEAARQPHAPQGVRLMPVATYGAKGPHLGLLGSF